MDELEFDPAVPLAITNYPGAVAVKRIDDPEVHELKDLTLHRADLVVCRDAIQACGNPEWKELVPALWTAVITRYYKCFDEGAASRFALKPSVILKVLQPLARTCFDHYRHLRNKHIAHDENAWSQAGAGIVIDAPTAPFKVRRVVSIAMNAAPAIADLQNMFELVSATLRWVETRMEALYVELGIRYEAKPREDLLRLPDVEFRAATAAEVSTTRAQVPTRPTRPPRKRGGGRRGRP